jgi:hypothetical protein
MATVTKTALLGLGGAAGLSFAAWKTLFPWIGYDIPIIKNVKGNAKRIMDDVTNGRFLIDLFEITAKANPKKPFIIFQDRIYTYEYRNEQACKVANISLELGLKMKDTAAILISNEPAFICTFLGEYYHLRIILDM